MAIHKRILDCLAALAMTISLLVGGPAYAQTFPELTGRVVDQANLLDPAQEADLTSKLAALETQTGRQFVVATVNSLEGRTIEDYGYRLGRQWGIGQEQTDDGVILLVAPNEKKVRIETGYGARVFLTDVVSGRIIRNTILPRFRDGDFAGGIAAGADQIIQMMQLPAAEAQRRVQEIAAEESARAADRGGSGAAFLPMLFVMIIFFVMLRSVARRAGGRRYRRRRGGGISPWVVLWGLDALGHASRGRGGWGGGGGFGGFGGGGGGGFGGFSGGGGSFGGGGASGGW